MPGLLKIGFTLNNLTQRIRSLNNTSVLFGLECYYAARVANCLQTELLIHKVFADKRVNPRREFFLLEREQAIAALKLAAIEDVTPQIDEVIPDSTERQAVERMSNRRRNTSMFDIGLSVGTALQLDRDPSVSCTIVGPWEIEFNGEKTSLSAAALQALNHLGFDWTSANGWAHWTFECRPLRAIVDSHLGNE